MPSTAILWWPVPSHGPPPIRLLSRRVICHIRSYKINFRLCNINEWWKRHSSHTVAHCGCNFVFHVTYLPISPKGRSRYEVFTVAIYNCQSNSNCPYRKILTYQTPQSNLPNGLFVNQNIAFFAFFVEQCFPLHHSRMVNFSSCSIYFSMVVCYASIYCPHICRSKTIKFWTLSGSNSSIGIDISKYTWTKSWNRLTNFVPIPSCLQAAQFWYKVVYSV